MAALGILRELRRVAGSSRPGLRWDRERQRPSSPKPEPPEAERRLAGWGLLCAGSPPEATGSRGVDAAPRMAPGPRVSPSLGCFSCPRLENGHNQNLSFQTEMRITEREASRPRRHAFSSTAFWKSPGSGDGKKTSGGQGLAGAGMDARGRGTLLWVP